MVGHTALWEVVCADSFAPVAGSYLAFPILSYFLALLNLGLLVKFCPKEFKGLVLVLVLASFILARYYDSGRRMCEPYCRIRFVNVLAARAGCPVGVNLNIIHIDFNVHIVSFGKNSHRNS